MRIVVIVLLVIAALWLLLWLGLKVTPAPLAPLAPAPLPATSSETRIPIPDGLPRPVDRFYRTLYGDSVPLIESAIVDGRARLKPFGFFMPSRFRFIYQAGKDYRHYIETTIFGLPLLRVNEAWVDGMSHFRIPIVGVSDNHPKENDSANLGLWAEMAFIPSVYLTDERVHWLPLDDDSAILVVPFVSADAPAAQQHFVVRFDPATGMLRSLEAMRFRGADGSERILWITQMADYAVPGDAHYGPTGTGGTATWLDQGTPWAYFMPDTFQFNVAVDDLLHREGAE